MFFYTVLGNHDLKMMNSRKEVEDIISYENATFSLDIKGYHLVFLCTDIRNELGNEHGGIYKTQYVSEKELAWLEKDLEKNILPTVIFTHFGIAEVDLTGNFWFEKDHDGAVLKNNEEVKEK